MLESAPGSALPKDTRARFQATWAEGSCAGGDGLGRQICDGLGVHLGLIGRHLKDQSEEKLEKICSSE